VYDKMVIENLNKGENMEIKENFLQEFPSKIWFESGIFSEVN